MGIYEGQPEKSHWSLHIAGNIVKKEYSMLNDTGKLFPLNYRGKQYSKEGRHKRKGTEASIQPGVEKVFQNNGGE